MNEKVSLVIPCQNDKTNLYVLLNTIERWESYPNEIIIVDSSINLLEIPDELNNFFKLNNITFRILHKKNL